jgi:type I restriction enzyme R subunit
MPANPLGELFDRDAEFDVSEAYRPHWAQAGAITYITIRLKDSIPKEVIRRWDREKQDWLARRGFNRPWREVVPELDPTTRKQFKKEFNRTKETFLDSCHGDCVLRRRELAKVVAESLTKFDGDRYHMGDFIVMPNHVHLLAAFPNPELMLKQCAGWMRYTAREINLLLGRTGKLWQQEPFDHLVRSQEQYNYLRDDIRDNPIKARLPETDYLYRRLPD